VADGLGYTNEAALVRTGNSFMSMKPSDGSSPGFAWGQTVPSPGGDDHHLRKGTYPDGLASDAEGGIWITSIVSNRVIRVQPDGAHQLILEDADAAHVEWVERSLPQGHHGPPHLDHCAGRC